MLGEDHGTREALGRAGRKNSPAYGERHVAKVVLGTRETLTRTRFFFVRSGPISPKGEMASCGKGVGGDCSTNEARTTKPCGGKSPCFVQAS
jgi:hypothetical protein